MPSSTAPFLTPPEVARYFLEAGLAKHRSSPVVILLKAFIAGIFLSFGGLLSEVAGGGSAGLNSTNPGLVKLLSGFVFPVGLQAAAARDVVSKIVRSMPSGFPFGSSSPVPLTTLTTAEYIKKSLFAAFFGNIVGALLLALPFTYFYLSDYQEGNLNGLEEGTGSGSQFTAEVGNMKSV
ncbi:hypothetical protein Clacol_005079 [Clathrus columnatus]|uniref:Uncharacterized protein n=1 Tax=Clathrus columnatus TaxID=1419009 RepID=A0AAV5AEC3_9AGAM|nr:hypothetical protein Clacol_005079 [Clathrus columnatus]